MGRSPDSKQCYFRPLISWASAVLHVFTVYPRGWSLVVVFLVTVVFGICCPREHVNNTPIYSTVPDKEKFSH